MVSTQATALEVEHGDGATEAGPSRRPAVATRFSDLVDTSLERKPRGFFADQFENDSNFQAHYHGTGPEILRQTGGHIDAFVSGAGTGGTISGTGTYLKKHAPDIKVILSDPEGEGTHVSPGPRCKLILTRFRAVQQGPI